MSNQELAVLEAKQWILEEIDGQTALAKSPNDGMGTLGKPYIEFALAENLYSGMASCNSVSGKIKVSGNKINFFGETATAMACKEPLMKQEKNFVALLQKVTRFELSEQTLSLYAEDKLVLKFLGAKKGL